MTETAPNRPLRRVLVLGSEPRSTLSIVRSLGRAGIEVHLGWCLPGAPPAKSRYVTRLLDLPFPLASGSWPQALIDEVSNTGYDVVIPSSDLEVIPLQIARHGLEAHTKLAIPDERIFKICFDKIEGTKLAAKLWIPVPRWIVLDGADARLPADFRIPCVLKPSSSFELDAPTQTKRYVRHIFTESQLHTHLREMLKEGRVVAQEYFVGSGLGIELLAKDGVVLSAFQHVRLHEHPGGSGSSYRESVPVEEKYLLAAQRFVTALKYSGVMMVEFKHNGADWIFVEINARFWGSLPLGLAAGSDMPLYLYQMMVEGRTDFPANGVRSVTSRNLVNDASWFIQNWRGDRRSPYLIHIGRLRSIADLLPLITGRDHIDTFVRDDPQPGWGEIRERVLERRLAAARRLGKAFSRAVRMQSARPSWESANSILFLCKGNICRSPFAEELAKRIWADKIIESAGTFLAEDRPSPPEAIEAAKEFGIALEHKRSRMVDAKLLARFDRIIIFDDEQAAWLRTHYPETTEKVDYLDNVIPDPFGSHFEAFHACYSRIARALARDHFYHLSEKKSAQRTLATRVLGAKLVYQIDEYRNFLSVRRKPDRDVLRDIILPDAARRGGKILWIGCRRYTKDYPALLERYGGECWSTDIDPVVVIWGRTGRHRTGDIQEASKIFHDMRFQTILCNGMFGFGIDSQEAQRRCLEELAKIAAPGATLVIGWNTSRTPDPVTTGLVDDWFVPDHTSVLGARYSCPNSTHVYDFLRQRITPAGAAKEEVTLTAGRA